MRRTKEEVLLLAVSIGGVAIAALTSRAALPPDSLSWLATAVALGVAGACAFAYALGRAASRTMSAADDGDLATARELISAIPNGMLLVQGGRIVSVNRRLCELLGFARSELVGQTQPFPFWPPELRHELDTWHATLERQTELEGELTFCRRNGERVHVVVASRHVPVEGDTPRYVLTVHDVSAGRRRERRLAEICGRDPHTGLPEHAEFEVLLGGAVRRAIAYRESLAVVLVELSVDGQTGPGLFSRPEALVAVERLGELSRADDVLARTGDGELAWVLPATDAHGAVGAVARARTALAFLPGVALTVGICDLETAGDALVLCAFADRALVEARGQGVGGTAQFAAVVAA